MCAKLPTLNEEVPKHHGYPMDFPNPVAARDKHLVCLTQDPIQRTLKTPELSGVILQEKRTPGCPDGARLNTRARSMFHDTL